MAEAILKKIISGRPDADQWRIESAGTWADSGDGPAYLSKYVMEQMGMDISKHQSKPVSLRLLENFDLILTMELDHKKWLETQYKEFTGRIYLLSEMVGDVADISDPMGGELFDYQQTAFLLERILTDGLDRILELTLSQYQ
jgi:protein-tyrosine phosphatase